jgi:hypothetical protein
LGRKKVMSAIEVLRRVDAWIQDVFAPAPEPPRPPMAATDGTQQRLDVLIAETRGLRQAVERLVELQAENLRLKVAGPGDGLALVLSEAHRDRVATAGRANMMDLIPPRPEPVDVTTHSAALDSIEGSACDPAQWCPVCGGRSDVANGPCSKCIDAAMAKPRKGKR